MEKENNQKSSDNKFIVGTNIREAVNDAEGDTKPEESVYIAGGGDPNLSPDAGKPMI